MAVSIKFLGIQRIVTNMDSIDMPITKNTRVSDALQYVRKQYPSLPLEEGMVLATVNLEAVPLDKTLRDNDTISFLPLIAGG